MDYKALHVKRDPETGAVAIRTVWAEEGAHAFLAWLVATPGSGAVTKQTADVDGWDDLYTPDEAIADKILLPKTPDSDI